MPKYKLDVVFHKAFDKEMKISAKDEDAAIEKAIRVVKKWDNVVDVKVVEIKRDFDG